MRSFYFLAVSALAVSPVFAADYTRTISGTSYVFKDYTYMGLPGRLYVPPTYNPSTPMPMVVFLHGYGERGEVDGTGNVNQVNGNIDNLIINAKNRGYLLFAPQSKAGWWVENETMVNAIGKVAMDYNVNPNKMYLTGLSAGGYGTMGIAHSYPSLFSAYIPLSMAGNDFTSPADGAVGVGRPTWYHIGTADTTTPMSITRNSLNNQLAAAGYTTPPYPAVTDTNYTYNSPNGLYNYTQYAGAGHSNTVWNNGAYNSSAVYTWMLNQTNTIGAVGSKAVNWKFGNSSTFVPAPQADGTGRKWNVVTGWANSNGTWTYANVGVAQSFAWDRDGARTKAIIEVTKPFAGQAAATLPAGSPLDTNTAGTYWHVATWSANKSGQLTISGLQSTTPYNLDIFASISTTAGDLNYQGIYSANGQSININAANNTSIYTLANIMPDALGKIALNVDIASGSQYGILNNLSLTAVPEPTAVFGMLGLSALLTLRRRNKA